jgi:hypothetical protein
VEVCYQHSDAEAEPQLRLVKDLAGRARPRDELRSDFTEALMTLTGLKAKEKVKLAISGEVCALEVVYKQVYAVRLDCSCAGSMRTTQGFSSTAISARDS